HRPRAGTASANFPQAKKSRLGSAAFANRAPPSMADCILLCRLIVGARAFATWLPERYGTDRPLQPAAVSHSGRRPSNRNSLERSRWWLVAVGKSTGPRLLQFPSQKPAQGR